MLALARWSTRAGLPTKVLKTKNNPTTMSECCPRRYVEAGSTVLLRTSCNAQCYVTPAMGYAVAGYAVAGYARVDYPVA